MSSTLPPFPPAGARPLAAEGSSGQKLVPRAGAEQVMLQSQQTAQRTGAQIDQIQAGKVNNPFAASERKTAALKKDENIQAKPEEPKKEKKCGGVIGKIFGGINNAFKKITKVFLAPMRFVAKIANKVSHAVLRYNPFSLLMRKIGLEKFDPLHYADKVNTKGYGLFKKGVDATEKVVNAVRPSNIHAKIAEKTKL